MELERRGVVAFLVVTRTFLPLVTAQAKARRVDPRLVVVDQITSPTARLLPTARITELAHERGARVLVDGRGAVADVLRELLGIWAGGGSAVLTSPATAAERELDDARLTRLLSTEQAQR